MPKTNKHIIVGNGRRCICGSYGEKSILCEDILRTLDWIEDYAQTELNPSLHVRKGTHHETQPPPALDLMRLVEVIRELVQECD